MSLGYFRFKFLAFAVLVLGVIINGSESLSGWTISCPLFDPIDLQF